MWKTWESMHNFPSTLNIVQHFVLVYYIKWVCHYTTNNEKINFIEILLQGTTPLLGLLQKCAVSLSPTNLCYHNFFLFAVHVMLKCNNVYTVWAYMCNFYNLNPRLQGQVQESKVMSVYGIGFRSVIPVWKKSLHWLLAECSKLCVYPQQKKTETSHWINIRRKDQEGQGAYRLIMQTTWLSLCDIK